MHHRASEVIKCKGLPNNNDEGYWKTNRRMIESLFETSEKLEDIKTEKVVLSDNDEVVKDRGQFKVEIPFYRHEEEKSVYYGIVLKNKNDKEVKRVNKRYSDFKALHLNMKSEMK